MAGDPLASEPDAALLARWLRELGTTQRTEAEQVLELARQVEAGEVPAPSALPVERLESLHELAPGSILNRAVWVPVAGGLEKLLAGIASGRLGRLPDPWRLVSRMRKVVARAPIRHADAQLRRLGDFVTWASEFGARTHSLKLPTSQLGTRVWRDVGLSMPGPSLEQPRLARLGLPTLPSVFAGAFEEVGVDSSNLGRSLDQQNVDVLLFGLAALDLALVVSACEASGTLPLLWVAGASLEQLRGEGSGHLHVAVPAGVVVLTDGEESRQQLLALGITAHGVSDGDASSDPATSDVQVATSDRAGGSAHVVRRRVEYEQQREKLRRLTLHAGLPNIGTGARLVSVICVSNRPDRAERCLDTFRRQKYPHKELVFVVNADHVSDALVERLAGSGPEVTLLRTDSAHSLGESLNRARAVARGDLWTKLDDDDHYGAHYLGDQVAALERSRASLVGKGTHYVYLEGEDALYLDASAPENAFSDRFVHGGTILASRRAVEDIEFMPVERGTDSLFLQQCKLLGHRIYSSDRFNFAYMRYKAAGHHTFDIRTRDLAARYKVVTKGFDTSIIDV